MSGKTQSEAVALLKSLPLGSKVKIVVSRQEDVVDNTLPRIIVSTLFDVFARFLFFSVVFMIAMMEHRIYLFLQYTNCLFIE